MNKLFLLFLLFAPFLSAQDYAEPEMDFAIVYPMPSDGKWCFSSSADSAVPVSDFYDTIHFCSSISGYPNFLAISENTYQLFDPGLNELSTGDYFDFLPHNDLLYIQRKNDWVEINQLTDQEKSIQADSIVAVGHILYVYKDNKMGLMEYETNIPPKYDRIAHFADPNASYPDDLYLVLEDEKFGLIDQDGEIIIPPVASMIQLENFGIIKYKVGTWKYLLPNGTILEPNGKEIHFYSDKLYKIYDSYRTKATLYDNEKVVVKAGRYDDVFPLNMYWAVRKNGKIGLLNSTYDLIKAPFCDQIENIDDYNNSLDTKRAAHVKYLIGDKWGLMDSKGRIVFPANYSNILEVIQNTENIHIRIALDGYVGVINEAEKVIIPAEYENVIRSGAGYVVEKNQRVGFLDLLGKEILSTTFTGYRQAMNFASSENSLMVFKKINDFIFVNSKSEVLPLPACIDFSYGNDVLKCYYPGRIEVHIIENGKIVETTKYPQIKKVKFTSSVNRTRGYGLLFGFHKTTLELNQPTGLYGARYKLKSGLGLKPTYRFNQESVFRESFDGGTFEDSVLVFQYRNFPVLKAYRVFNWMDQSNGSFEKEAILSSRVFMLDGWSGSGDDCSVLRASGNMEWIWASTKDRVDPQIDTYGLLHDERIDRNYQKVYVGGEFEFVPIAEADLSMMEYFDYLNHGRNLWFTSLNEARFIMNPTKGVKFTKGQLAIRDTRRYNRVPFKHSITEFKQEGMYYAFKKNNESRWTICKDLEKTEKIVDDIISFEETADAFGGGYNLILGRKVSQTDKKAIYDYKLDPMTKFIYDDIIPAGELGYLVRIGNNYSYYIEE